VHFFKPGLFRGTPEKASFWKNGYQVLTKNQRFFVKKWGLERFLDDFNDFSSKMVKITNCRP